MYGQRPTNAGARLSRAQSLTREAAKRAGADIFPGSKSQDARPRRLKDADEVERVEGTGIKFTLAMPIQPNRQTAGLSPVDAERVERMSEGRGAMRKW